MYGHSLIRQAFRPEPVERVPWVPFVGVHGGYLIDVDAENYLKSAQNMISVRKKEKLSSFFVCGHAQQNIEAMCNCRPDNVSIDENIPLEYVKEIALSKKISFGGNLKLTVVLLMGDADDAKQDGRKHPIKKMEVVSFMSSLIVKNIPTICIDGKIVFVSQIPPQNLLIEAIQKRINEKLKLKIKSKRSEILIFGETEQECREMNKRVKRAIAELENQLQFQ